MPDSDISSLVGYIDFELLAQPLHQRPQIPHILGRGITPNVFDELVVGDHQPKMGGEQI